jgi:serine/threonine-protein kinase
LGSGGAATVYLARSEGPHNFERLLALKVIHGHLLDEQEFVDMFLDEANIAVQLAHPNVVHVYDLAREGSLLFLAMEYLDGQPLSRLIARAHRRNRQVPLDVAAWIAARAAEGLHHAHELRDATGARIGVVHRDVSPQNVFLTYDGQVKVIDFGIARAEGRLAQTALGQVKGKFAYMSPEQALYGSCDHRADIFSLGVTLYESAVGARLFPELDRVEALHKIVLGQIPDPRERAAGFSEGLAAIIMRCLEGDAGQRYQTAAELSRALDEYSECSSGLRDQQERLAALLVELFEPERLEQAKAIQDLRTAGEAEPFADQTKSSFGVASAPPTLPPRKRRGRVAAVAAVAIALAAAAIFGIGTLAGRAVPSAPDLTLTAPVAPASISLEVAVQPTANATVLVQGKHAKGTPARAELARSTEPVEILISADGYEPLRIEAIPDRDQRLVVSLVAVPAPPWLDAGRDAEPARPRLRGTSRKRAESAEKTPIITEYPY